MSSREIRAGAAFVEVSIRDNLSQGLRRAQAKMAGFATGLKVIGGTLAVVGAGITAVMAKSVQTFMEVSKHAKDTGKSIAGIDPAKAERLSEAWLTFKATLGAIQFLLGDAIAEPLTKLLHVFISWGIEIANVVAQNSELLKAIGETVAFVAVAATDISGAFGVAFDAINVAWVAVTEGIKAAMSKAMAFVIDQVQSAVRRLADLVIGVGVTIEALRGGDAVKNLGLSIARANGQLSVPSAVFKAAAGAQTSDLAKKTAEAIATFVGGAIAQKEKINNRLSSILSFSTAVGGSPSRVLGSSQGTFSGAGASLFGVGSGGGQKVSDDKTHQALDRIWKAVGGLKLGVEFK